MQGGNKLEVCSSVKKASLASDTKQNGIGEVARTQI